MVSHQDCLTTCMDVVPALSSQNLSLLDLVQSPVTSMTGHLKSERSALFNKSSRLSLLHFSESTVLNQENFQSHKPLCLLVPTPFPFLFLSRTISWSVSFWEPNLDA